jgi:leucyl aminopeptidase
MEEANFEGKRGDVLAVPTRGRIRARAALLLGMGEQDRVDLATVRRAGAILARRSTKVSSVATTLLDAAGPDLDRGAAAQALAEGIGLGSYQFLRYKSDAKPTQLERVSLVGRGGAKVRAGVERGTRIAEAVAWARDLINEPAAAKSPQDVAELARKVGRASGLKVKVLEGEQLERERMGGVLGVGNGSQRPPRFVRLEYAPSGARATLALVGKGVVFDSGGLSLKTAGGMETMKTDMSGAAAVIATMSALRDLDVKQRVVGYVPLVENMPSGHAMRPGDVLKMRNGKTVEVLNTDAEGRLILADALALADDEGADAIVDIATLTGAVVTALGEKVAGLMGTNDAWIGQVQDAADRAGENVWHLPLPEEYRRNLDSEVADLRNISSGGGAGTLTAGLFLKEFAGDRAWAHLDIAGTARSSADDADITKGGTGFGVRTLVELARAFKAPKR